MIADNALMGGYMIMMGDHDGGGRMAMRPC